MEKFKVKHFISVLAGVFLFTSQAAIASEELAGLRYWNEIKKEAVTTESGLQYKVLIMGNGKKPTLKGKVRVHYRGLLLNGVQFDSSFDQDEPVKLSLKKVIKGWTEGIQLMPKGSVFVFLIPPELAYGSKGSDPIPPNSTLIFEVELFDF
ncbi:MAG: FKBP-type peptidyl-prolyl cis-trans isomerase [Gammaproteobacteria bacterium]|nr:FKBP-type peptidyl-prolyl cis-trans isomerase [Gammaproteobacteria bacterium]NNK97448.1 FKBP-type peptidyl-prolyl cis-trans isomerase [Xanthomonadales bacterium]